MWRPDWPRQVKVGKLAAGFFPRLTACFPGIMLARLSDQIARCLEEAELARFRAAVAATEEERQNCLRREENWQVLAQSFQLCERVSGWLEWQTERLRFRR
jgi:hypothetical protein